MSVPRIIPSLPNVAGLGVSYQLTTLNDTPDTIFNLPIEDNTIMTFRGLVQGISLDGLSYCAIERIRTYKVSSGVFSAPLEQAPYTERSSSLLNVYWDALGPEIGLFVVGDAAKEMRWTAFVQYSTSNF